ncbi:MAG: M48 family metalloprotease [Gaiellaceae bacterium]
MGDGALTRGRLLGAAGVLALAALWAVAIAWLWETRVPAGLELPPVELGIDAATIARAERFEAFVRILFLVSQLALVGVLALYAWKGARFARESAAGRIGTGMLLGMIGLGLVWLSQVPFRLAAVWWSRRYDQTDSGYVETLLSNWLELGAEFLAICFALAVVRALAGRFPRRWWIAAAPVFVAIGAAFTFAFPSLVQTEPLDRPALEADAKRYAAAQGIEPVPVRVEDVSDFTKTPNAYAVGLGPTQTVVLWSTLLDGRFRDGELRVVLAHELAHHSRRHLLEGIGWYALFALPGAWLIAVATRRRGGMAQPAAVPVSLLVLVVLELASTPVYNLVSRHMEQEADWVALETTRDPDSAAALFRRFTTESLNDPDPPRWAYYLFDSHPTTRQRIALAEAWRRAR